MSTSLVNIIDAKARCQPAHRVNPTASIIYPIYQYHLLVVIPGHSFSVYHVTFCHLIGQKKRWGGVFPSPSNFHILKSVGTRHPLHTEVPSRHCPSLPQDFQSEAYISHHCARHYYFYFIILSYSVKNTLIQVALC